MAKSHQNKTTTQALQPEVWMKHHSLRGICYSVSNYQAFSCRQSLLNISITSPLLPSVDVLRDVIPPVGYAGKAKEKEVRKKQSACTRQEIRQEGVRRVERVPDGLAKPEGFAGVFNSNELKSPLSRF